LAHCIFKTKDLYVIEQLKALKAKKETEAKPDGADTAMPSSSDSEKEAEFLLKEGFSDLKKTWHKMRGKDKVASTEKVKAKMSLRLAALLVYTVGVKCHGVDSDIEYAPEHIFSLSENSANRFLKASMANFVKHNHTHLVRIYPKGTRVYSTNYQPHRYWAAGAQVAAINWQTFG
jgi:phosphatidylinositol phospholipase C, delta